VLTPHDVERHILALLRARFGAGVGAILPLMGGEFSRAFAFDAGDRAYVVRVSESALAAGAFAKDEYASRRFAAPGLPIPRVVARGAFAGLQFAISERAAGDRVAALPPSRRAALAPALLDLLDRLAAADVGGSRGYGPWAAVADGEFTTWHAFLVAIAADRTGGYYRDWHDLFRTSFLERDLFDALYGRMLTLAAHCPEERHLLHGDLHFDNLLSDGERITGVIDWGNALYGDPLYDAAWLGRVNSLGEQFVPPVLLDARYGALPYYRERLACYELALGLDDLRFYAKTGRREQYDAIRALLLPHLASPGS